MRLTKELRETARRAGTQEARFLVDTYYQIQDYRKAANNQISAATRADNPPVVLLLWVHDNMESLERSIKSMMLEFAEHRPLGQWAMSIKGIGPVIAVGLMAHIDITQAETVGSIWRFAGLDPTTKWAKAEKRPWNAQLKTLCWKIGESFVKFSGHDDCLYGQVWAQRKREEEARNEAGEYAEQAADVLAAKPRHKQAAIYREGRLPPGHIHARAKRYAVKLFLAHYHHVAYEIYYDEPPPKPYIIEHGGHTDYIGPPNWPME